MAALSKLESSGRIAVSGRSGSALLLGLEDCGQAFEQCFKRHWAEEPSLSGLPPPGSGLRVMRLLASLARAQPKGPRFQTLCRRLARAWRCRGAGPLHFDAGGAVLLRSLADCLGPAFDDHEDVWATLYGEAVETMLQTFEPGCANAP